VYNNKQGISTPVVCGFVLVEWHSLSLCVSPPALSLRQENTVVVFREHLSSLRPLLVECSRI